jgi:hypothetical protein
MLEFAAPAHGILTLVLMALYLVLAIRFFRSKTHEASLLDQFLVQIARYTLLLIFISGLILNMLSGAFVSKAHHIISIVPALLVVGIKYLPQLRRKANTIRTYAWLFVILFGLMILLAISAKLMTMPQF